MLSCKGARQDLRLDQCQTVFRQIHFAIMDEIEIVYGNRIFELRLLCWSRALKVCRQHKIGLCADNQIESSSHIVCALRISKKRTMLAGLPENFNHARARSFCRARLVSGGDAQLRVKNVKDACSAPASGYLDCTYGVRCFRLRLRRSS